MWLASRVAGYNVPANTFWIQIHSRLIDNCPTLVWTRMNGYHLLLSYVLEAFSSLHTKGDVLHNDLISSNIALGNDIDTSSCNLLQLSTGNYHVVVVDFSKATKLAEGKIYHLNRKEKEEYYQISTPGTRDHWRWIMSVCFSDINAVEGIINMIADRKCNEHRMVLWITDYVFLLRHCYVYRKITIMKWFFH